MSCEYKAVRQRLCVAIPITKAYCGVIFNGCNNGWFQPKNSHKYIAVIRFEFTTTSDSVQKIIVGRLKYAGVYPKGDQKNFLPAVNPHPAYYNDLPYEQMNTVITIIRETLFGIAIHGSIIETIIPQETVDNLINAAITRPDMSAQKLVVSNLDINAASTVYILR